MTTQAQPQRSTTHKESLQIEILISQMIEGVVIVFILHLAVIFGIAELLYEVSQELGETTNAFAKLCGLGSAAQRHARSGVRLISSHQLLLCRSSRVPLGLCPGLL